MSTKKIPKKFLEALTSNDTDFPPEFADEEVAILLYGNNMFGDAVYSYIKFTLKDFQLMRNEMVKGEDFKPSDYGQVLAAGRGEPSVELKKEMEIKYGLVSRPKPKENDKNKQEVDRPPPDFTNEEPMKGLNKKVSIDVKKIGHEIKRYKTSRWV